MKRSIGYFMVLAAVILIVCSATTLFWSAYESAVEPWQKWVQGVQIVAVIGWEAGAILAIAYCWRHRYYLIAIGGSVLLVLAMGYTLSGEMRLQAGTQENTVARRSAEAGKIELVKSELDKAIKRRDLLQAQRRLTEDQREELTELRKDISSLKRQWEPLVEETSAVGIPGAALIARWTGLNITDSGDLDALIKMAFWTMVRVFALPLAVFGMMAASQERKEASGRAKAPEAPSLPLKVFPPAQPRTALPESPIAGLLSRKMGNSPEIPDSSPEPDQPPPGDAATVETPAPVEAPPARPVLVTEDWKPTPPLSKKQRKLVQRERLKDDAIRAVEEFAAAKLDLESVGARFIRSEKGFVQSGGTPGTQLGKEFRQWAKSNSKWAHFSTYDKIPLGKALSAVLEQGRPSNGGGSVYAALIKQPVRRAA
jgi:hypothetical protein